MAKKPSQNAGFADEEGNAGSCRSGSSSRFGCISPNPRQPAHGPTQSRETTTKASIAARGPARYVSLPVPCNTFCIFSGGVPGYFLHNVCKLFSCTCYLSLPFSWKYKFEEVEALYPYLLVDVLESNRIESNRTIHIIRKVRRSVGHGTTGSIIITRSCLTTRTRKHMCCLRRSKYGTKKCSGKNRPQQLTPDVRLHPLTWEDVHLHQLPRELRLHQLPRPGRTPTGGNFRCRRGS